MIHLLLILPRGCSAAYLYVASQAGVGGVVGAIMNFQGLAKVEKADWYIDLAFRNAKKSASEMKGQIGKAGPDVIKRAELAKISAVRRVFRRHFEIILTSFPSLDTMPEFYQELVRITLDYAELKKSLGALRWAQQKVEHFSDFYQNRIKRCRDFPRMTAYSREYYGRISSVIKQVKKQLEYLELARRTMKEYPAVKTKMFTVCIAGFPNVGKTTLLSKLTGSKPEIADYAFTTKKLNVGYATINNHKVQFIDTPGTLNRFEKMNPIEQQAHLAMKYCADMTVFVFDSSEQGYAEEQQMKLLKSVRSGSKEFAVYISKTDIADEQKITSFLSRVKKDTKLSKSVYKDPKDLKVRIGQLLV
ncbi:50S ribosome-binding GTPase [Candidatus Woesearchaeota archaeon]|nr:50S ribosome-binding GTPase [Candidatus Woesearchaeota archaeon]